jgi:hypothetical protein
MLKKEFQKRDVTRLRNLITKKYGDKTISSIGYDKIDKEYNEGDIWEEDGRKWTIKNGIKQNITKLNKAKKALSTPHFCPECNNIMNKPQDRIFYLQFNRCFDCQIDFEAEIKRLGLWEEYEKNIINQDIDTMTHDFEIWFTEQILNSSESYISENGEIEKWIEGGKDILIKNKEETIKYLQSYKK